MLTGQRPGPSHECPSPEGLTHVESFSGRGVLPGHGPRSPQSLHRGSCSLKPPTQGRGRAGAWQAFAGEMLEECVWWGPGPVERSQGPGGLVVTAAEGVIQQQKGRSVGAWKP